MRRLFLSMAVCCITCAVYPQVPSPYVAVQTGVSMPVGSFHATSLEGGSFALAGWRSTLEGAWFSRCGLGAGLQAGYGAYPVDVEALAAEKMKDNPFIETLTVRSDPVRVITLGGLAAYSFPLATGLSITAKAGGGVIFGWSPYQLYKPAYFTVGEQWYEITSDYDIGPWFTAGATLSYFICECLDVHAGIGYDHGFLTYKFLTGTGDIRQEDHQVMTLNATAGIAFTF